LILLPVAALVAVGLWTLREDRAAMERDARFRSEPIAAKTLAEIKYYLHPIQIVSRQGTREVSVTGEATIWFEIRPDNSLDQPWPLTWPPTPAPFPADAVARLQPERAELWHAGGIAQAAGNWEKVVEAYSAFATNGRILKPGNSRPYDGLTSERLRGEAHWRIAAAQLQRGETNRAIEAYDSVLRSFSNGNDTRSEAGLPMTHLAALRVFELTPDLARLPRWWDTNFFVLYHLLAGDSSPFGDGLVRRFRALFHPTAKDLALPENMKNSPESLKQVWRENRAATHKITERTEI
jgi:hypothetical protein